MKKLLICLSLLLLCNCQNFGQLTMIADLPKDLEEVSGTEMIIGSDIIWMLNDSGNKSEIFGVSKKGNIKEEIDIKSKNHDWEDLTSDDEGNLYIGDFGNNLNKRKNLAILILDKKDLDDKNADVKKIKFKYPNQDKFPPKKKDLYFDSESFFYFNNHLYIFTKSRVHDNYGKTSLYKVPAKKGNHTAKLIGKYDNGNDVESWITSADISPNKDKVVLLSQKNILIFSDFKDDNFFSGKVEKITLSHYSQKEGICFKDANTLLITDEKAQGEGGNLYELKI
ncbi:hypothetical protein [Polaribacter sp. Asnod1-A03]|uniref:hypothetical protein n=1 Tax=Polaribacter sp. Asnod1-A03 TaxID=3160581 RepID=UPI00386BAEA6